MPITFTSIERVSFAEDRVREARYWAERSMAERVVAGWALADGDLTLRESDEQEKRTGITLRRVARGGR
jgi:hypothetical protein